jgi:UDP-glucose 4-epimerase
MKRSFILGAGGFLGHHLASALTQSGERPVLAGLRAPLALEGESDQIVSGHLTSFDVLDAHAGEGDTYYYLIASMTPSNSLGRPSDFIAENLELFVRFLEWVEQKPGARVVYASSGGTVYGNADVVPTPESAPLKPISYYGLLKSTCEQYLQLFAAQGRLEGTITRISNPFGPGQKLNRGQGLIPALISRIRAGEPIDVINEGRSVRDYIFIDDAIEALRLAGSHPALRNETVNVGSGRGTSVNDVIALVEHALEIEAVRKVQPGRFGDVETNILDCSKMYRLTGWQADYTLETGLKACL